MRKYIFSILIALLTLPVIAQQQQSQAKVVLDKTAEVFRKAGGIKADFTVKSFSKGNFSGEGSGTIQLKGDKFLLKTPESITWFDGKTQWSYLTGSDEVNISTPTPEELQTLNPYMMLSIYQKGFSYKLGAIDHFRGTPVYQIILTSTDRKQDLACIIVYITKDTYQPLFILLQQRGNKNRSEITITNYKTGLDYTDSTFVFDKKQYPQAEIIDLR